MQKTSTTAVKTVTKGDLDSYASCTACGKRDVQLFRLEFGVGMPCTTVVRLCEDCVDDLRHNAFDALTGRC